MLGGLVDVLATVALATGLALATIALFGLLRKREIFGQLHAGGLVTGPAVVLVLLASVGTGSIEVITSAGLVILFVPITSPLATHAIAQAARRQAASDESPAGDEEAPAQEGSARSAQTRGG